MPLPSHFVTTTNDPPSAQCFVLRVEKTARGWAVADLVTTRFGYGETLPEALSAWVEDLRTLIEIDGPFGPPIAAEVEWARQVFKS